MADRSAHDKDRLVLFLRDDGLDELLPPKGDEENDRRKDQGDASGRAPRLLVLSILSLTLVGVGISH